MSDPSNAPNHHSRGLRAFFRRWRRGETAAEAAAQAAHAPRAEGSLDLVDQAQAFKMLSVEDVMTPRADIVAVEIACPFNELLARFLEAEHTRMPIYRGNLDDPVGQVHVKDVFKMLVDESIRPAPDETVLRRLRREVLYAPGSMRAGDLMVKMQASRIHMALIIDEFGGTDGLVTLEDLIEAVVGEIDDEHDEAVHARVVTRPGGLIEADGRAPLEDLEAAMERSLVPDDLEEEDIDTVAGLVSALAGRVPQRGEVIAHPAGFDFEITDADPRRVKRLRVRPHPPAAAVEADAAPNPDGE
ncbi:MAG TPA: hemolysin family protein [Caulobacteraceae bacterium]|jgi:CBS domain containing-hemolysin-like protein|nr:hemolysin family protein [Caulobacteraceae bacterium]